MDKCAECTCGDKGGLHCEWIRPHPKAFLSLIEALELELAEERALSADLARAVSLYCRWEHSSLKNYMEKYPDWKAP